MNNQPDHAHDALKYYPPAEERLNIVSHAAGFFLSFIGLVLLLQKASVYKDRIYLFSVLVFGMTMCLLYAASTIYHSSKEPSRRKRWRTFDHAAIYLLIAGTYTPFTLISLRDSIGITIFFIVWSIAFLGIILKLFFTGKFHLLSTIAYVAMGWQIAFAYRPMLDSLPTPGLSWILAGGFAYTIGAVLYMFKKLPYHHAIFHVFVLAGSFCHFMAVYWYVL